MIVASDVNMQSHNPISLEKQRSSFFRMLHDPYLVPIDLEDMELKDAEGVGEEKKKKKSRLTHQIREMFSCLSA